MNKKTDRRILRTRKAIHSAFAELITVKRLKEITVKDIADKANINRKTFYNHYNDIGELISDIENDIIQAFDEAMDGINVQTALSDPEDLCQRFLAIGHSCRDICSHLMNIRYNGEMVNMIAEELKKSILKSPNAVIHVDDKTLDMLMNFGVAGMLQTYQDWFNSDRSESIESVTRRVSYIIVNGINGIIPERLKEERNKK